MNTVSAIQINQFYSTNLSPLYQSDSARYTSRHNSITIAHKSMGRRWHIELLHKIGLVHILDTFHIPEQFKKRGLTRTNLVYYLDKTARRIVGIKTIEEHLKNDGKFFMSNLMIKGRDKGINSQLIHFISDHLGNKINTWEDTMRLLFVDHQQTIQNFAGEDFKQVNKTLLDIARDFDQRRIHIKPINPTAKQYDTEIGVRLNYFLKELENSLPQEKYQVYRELLTNLINAEEAQRIENAVKFSHKADPEKIIYDLSKLNATKVSVMFTDVVGSTDLWNKVWKKSNNGEDLTVIAGFMNQLNQFLKEMGAVIRFSGATVDKYIGDAIMGYSQKPVELVKAGIAMREVITILQKIWQANGMEKIDIRSGIGTGKAILTWVGKQPLNKSVFGPTANLAARIEASTKQAKHNLVICEQTYKELGDTLKQEDIHTSINKAVNYGEEKSFFNFKLNRLSKNTPPYDKFNLKGFDESHTLYQIDNINVEQLIKNYLNNRNNLLGSSQEELDMTETMKHFYDTLLKERHHTLLQSKY